MFTTRPELAGTFGMVASTHWLASAAGMAVLEDGGNAFDAAVATGFALHVVEPHLNGPGGEVPAVFATATDPTPMVLCGQGVAPAGATIEHYRSEGLELVPGTGLLAATVPGAVGGWLTLLRDHGTKSLAEVLRFAIAYADGHPLTARVARTVETVADLFATDWESSARVWLPGGRVPAAGAVFANPALAATYRRLVAEAQGTTREAQIDAALRAWYQGFVAEAIDAFARTEVVDDSGRHAGVLTGADLAAWSASYEAPVRFDWQGLTVCKAGAWSQGPVLLQQLALLDDLPAYGSAELIHTAVEAAKLAFADREAYYGDEPGVPLPTLLSADYNRARRELIGAEAARGLRPGSPDGRTPRLPDLRAVSAAGPSIGEPTVAPLDVAGEPVPDPRGTTRGDTCHVDVVDAAGNIISATPSGGWLQSSPAVPGLGFPLGTRAQMFWLEEGLPNSLAPGKRPRTTLTPTLALRGEDPVLAFGTPGGDQQDQWQLCFLLAHVLGGLDLQASIDAPAWHSTAFPSSFFPRESSEAEVVIEGRIGADVLDELRRRGHDVTVADDWSLGRLSAVSRDPETGVLRAAANPRGMQGYAAGR
ncbi:MAG TPA: gamma-glutamyltransferase family protein [Mycobacteriales bacterium]|nr:gamma-glutamyltransferase family protein [Mycobacteriales bacterium]